MAIKPIYVEELPNGDALFGLAPSDHEKIRQGYGCPRCLEDFTEYGANGVAVVFGKCPVCGHRLNVDTDFLKAPQHWLPDPNDPRYND